MKVVSEFREFNLLSQENHSKAIPHFVCLVSDQTYQHIPLLTHFQITLCIICSSLNITWLWRHVSG